MIAGIDMPSSYTTQTNPSLLKVYVTYKNGTTFAAVLGKSTDKKHVRGYSVVYLVNACFTATKANPIKSITFVSDNKNVDAIVHSRISTSALGNPDSSYFK
jgi:hypothetical protein